MTHSHDEGNAQDHDPTGVRDLLSRLPAPGPMPDELVARITAALAAESDAARDDGRAAGGDVVGLPVRRRSPRLRHLGVAAAVVTAIGLGGYGLAVVQGGGAPSVDALTSGDDSGGSASEAESGTDASARADGQGEAAPGSGQEDTEPLPRAAPPAGSGEVVVVMSGTQYTSGGLAAEASALTSGPLDPLPDLAAEAPTIGPIATPIGARACAEGLGVDPSAGLVVDVAQVDGRPAAVLVAFGPGGRTAYAVERSCTTGTSSPIGGPVSLE